MVDVEGDDQVSTDEEEVELSSDENSSGEEDQGGGSDSGGEHEISGSDKEEEGGSDDNPGQSDESGEEEDEDDDTDDTVPQEEEDDSNKDSDNEEDKPQEISGWADSIAKILKSTKPKNKKEMMLSRARKDYEVSQAVAVRKKVGKAKIVGDDLEIIPLNKASKVEDQGQDEAGDGKSKEKAPPGKKKEDKLLSLKVQRKLELKQKKLELAWENLARMRAETTDPQLERDLVKMATKGVVQLFNAISMQQKTIKTKLRTSEKSEFKKDKVLHQTKDIFDNAMSKSKRLTSSGAQEEAEVKEEEVSSSEDDEEIGGATVSIKINKRPAPTSRGSDGPSKKKPVWNALQDNFMLDAKLKDWDKDSDDSN